LMKRSADQVLRFEESERKRKRARIEWANKVSYERREHKKEMTFTVE